MNSPKTLDSSLVPNLLITFAGTIWRTMWLAMMKELAPTNEKGEYQRKSSQFRDTVGNEQYLISSGRYYLYIGLSCPWAHRTLVVRALKGLEETIPVVQVIPSATSGGWVFNPAQNGCSSLRQFYRKSSPSYRGRATVPVFWDSLTQKIVNNESSEIIKMLNDQFNDFAQYAELDLYPLSLQEEIELWNDKIYHAVNNGVYRCGFAQTQTAYQDACLELFNTLNELELVLSQKRYLCGDLLTLADVRLFTTLFRFDAVYYGLFKCNLQRIQDYTHLSRYLQDIYQLPGVAATCDLERVKLDYYGQLFPLNPGGIVPLGLPKF